MPQQRNLLLAQIIQQKRRHIQPVIHEQIIGQRDIVLPRVVALAAIPLVPGHDRIDIRPLPCKSIIIRTRRRTRPAVQIQQHRVIQILTIDADPLPRPIDLHVHRLIHAALRHRRVHPLPDKSHREKKHDQARKDKKNISNDLKSFVVGTLHVCSPEKTRVVA